MNKPIQGQSCLPLKFVLVAAMYIVVNPMTNLAHVVLFVLHMMAVAQLMMGL